MTPTKYLLISLLGISSPLSADPAVPLRFCFEDKQLLPYYAGEGEQVAQLPGVTIEHLQASVSTIPELSLQLQRKPWLRCLQLLEQNKVDALVATYDKARRQFAVYPLASNNKPDPARALSHHASCLVQRIGDDVLKRQAKGVVYARPLGYASPGYADTVTVVPVDSQQKAFELVRQGRVDATTTLCEVNALALPESLAEGLQIVRPALYHTTGYLVYSTAFYQQQPELARRLWRALALHRDPSRYYRYLQMPEQQPD